MEICQTANDLQDSGVRRQNKLYDADNFAFAFKRALSNLVQSENAKQLLALNKNCKSQLPDDSHSTVLMLQAQNAELTSRNQYLADRIRFLEKCLNDVQPPKAFEFADALPEQVTKASGFIVHRHA